VPKRSWPLGIICAAVLLALPLALFAPVLFSGRAEFIGAPGEDAQSLFYPWRAYGFGVLREGAIPLWNPHAFCGYPFVGGIESAIFYPPNWLFTAMPTWLALNVSVVLHVFAAGLFTWLWMRALGLPWWAALLSGVTFQFAAPHILRTYAGQMSVLCAVPWMPLVFLCAERMACRCRGSTVVLSVAVLSLQVLAGHPQTFAYTVMVAAVYFAVRWGWQLRSRPWQRSAWCLAGALVAVLGSGVTCAVQLAPSMQMASHSIRRGGMPLKVAGTFSLPPKWLATLVVPESFGGRAPDDARKPDWERTLYSGVLPLGLALLALAAGRGARVWAIAAAAAVALLLALGRYTPLFTILYHAVPGYGAFRGSSKFGVVLALMLSALCGHGAAALIERVRPRSDRRGRHAWWLGAGFGATVVALLIVLALSLDGKGGGPAASAAASCWRSGALVAAGLAALVAARLLSRRRWMIAAFLLVVTTMDLAMFARPYVKPTAAARCHWPAELVGRMRAKPWPVRAATGRGSRMNLGMVDRLSTMEGFHPTPLFISNEFYKAAQLETALRWDRRLTPRRWLGRRLMAMPVWEPSRLTDLANVGFFLRSANRGRVLPRPEAFSRVRVVNGFRVIADDARALRALASGAVDPSGTIVLAAQPTAMSAVSASISTAAAITSYQPQRVTVSASLAQPGFVVLADTWYRGWKCYATEQGTGQTRFPPLLRAYAAFRAVQLPAGRWDVVFYYDPLVFKVGVAVSLAAIGALGLAAAALVLRR